MRTAAYGSTDNGHKVSERFRSILAGGAGTTGKCARTAAPMALNNRLDLPARESLALGRARRQTDPAASEAID